jgi:hypothetical protein
MSLRVRISEPALLPDLVDVFLRNGCVANAVADDSCVVVHVHARDPAEAHGEVAFFLSAWRTLHAGLETALES